MTWQPTFLSPLSAAMSDLVNQRVLISDLASRADLNGQVGNVEAFVESSGRCRVRVSTGEALQPWIAGMPVPDEVYAPPALCLQDTHR